MILMSIIIFNMNAQSNAEDSMNFSVIDKNESHQVHLDFSVRSLLENNDNPAPIIKQQLLNPQAVKDDVFRKVKQMQQNKTKSIIRPTEISVQENSQQFLKDLSRMQKELSFEVESHNIYEDPQNNSIEILQNNKSKTLSYLKVTKEFTNKSISKESLQDFNDYYGELIIDFRRKVAKIKDKVIGKNGSKNACKHISEQSSQSNVKSSKNSTSRDHSNNFYRLKDLKSSSRTKVNQYKKSKSKSLTHKLNKMNSKSHSNLISSTQCQTCQDKVFTEYYGTQVNFYPPNNDKSRKKGEYSGIIASKITSKDKSSKQKIKMLSPRTKINPKAQTKK